MEEATAALVTKKKSKSLFNTTASGGVNSKRTEDAN